MRRQHVVGNQRWEGYLPLCRPLELLGIDRRLFGLLVINFMVFWQGMGSFLLGAGVTAAIYWAFRLMTKVDPQFFSVLRASAKLPAAWYDPGRAPTVYGPLILDDPAELRLIREAQKRGRPRRTASGRNLLIDLRELIFPSSSERD